MIASHICKDLYEWILKGENQGEIHSIFKNSINILGSEGRFISVVTGNKPVSPNGIKIKDEIAFNTINVNIGERGIFTETSFTTKNLSIYYGDCIIWDKKINIPYKKDNLQNVLHKIQLIGDFILDHGNKNGIFNLLPILLEGYEPKNILYDRNHILEKRDMFIKDRFLKFIESFKNSQLEEIRINAKNIIGFGPGLTPSMDDFLCGMMIANIYISHCLEMDMENAYKINKEIIKDLDNRTTMVSQEMLKLSSMGEANEHIRSLIISVLDTSEGEKIHELSMAVAELGDSSGTDILSGIYIGSLILLNKIKGGYEWA